MAFAGAHLWATAQCYDADEAIKFARLSVAAYCGYPQSSDSSLRAWQCGPACDAVDGMTSVRPISSPKFDDAFAFVGKLDDYCVLSFRGTSNLAGWIQDLKSGLKTNLNHHGIDCHFDGHDCKVGTGFYNNYRNLKPMILGNMSEIGCSVGSSLAVTGHSLGAAEAAVAMFDLGQMGFNIRPTYTFASPRVGNKAFAGAFNQAFGNRVQRVTHYYDPVPHLPPSNLGYEHFTQEVFFEEHWSDGYTVCDSVGEDPKCADQYWDVALMITNCVGGQVFQSGSCDHLTYYNDGFLGYNMDGESCADQTRSVVSV